MGDGVARCCGGGRRPVPRHTARQWRVRMGRLVWTRCLAAAVAHHAVIVRVVLYIPGLFWVVSLIAAANTHRKLQCSHLLVHRSKAVAASAGLDPTH